MTYSQRLSDEANSSDIIYLEHQIEMTKEELRIALEEKETCERELAHLHSSSVGSAPINGSDDSNEQALLEKSNQTQASIETLSTQLVQLEEALAKLGD